MKQLVKVIWHMAASPRARIIQLHSPDGVSVHPICDVAPGTLHTSRFSSGISIGSAVFARFSGLPDTHTDTPTTERATCVRKGRNCRIYAMHAMRPILKQKMSHIYRVVQKSCTFSTHHIFGSVQREMKRISPKCS